MSCGHVRSDEEREVRRSPMTTWTSEELRKIDAAEELELASVRRNGRLRNPRDHLGRPRRRRPLRPLMEGPRWRLVPRHSSTPRRSRQGGPRREKRRLCGRSRRRHQRSDRRIPQEVPAPWRTLRRPHGGPYGASRHGQAGATPNNLVVRDMRKEARLSQRIGHPSLASRVPAIAHRFPTHQSTADLKVGCSGHRAA